MFVRKIKKKLFSLKQFWRIPLVWHQVSWWEKVLFLILCGAEYFYKIIFAARLYLVRNHDRMGHKFQAFCVISVGNISTGGTGKSLFSHYLINYLGQNTTALVLKGYGGSYIKKNRESLVLSDITSDEATAFFVGDEAFVAARRYNIPVVIGVDKFKSIQLLDKWLDTQIAERRKIHPTPFDILARRRDQKRLQENDNEELANNQDTDQQSKESSWPVFEQWQSAVRESERIRASVELPPLQKISHVIVDDGYQSLIGRRDLNILLLDARAPFGNGHCLPAGELRERDVTRADLIVMTHADLINDDEREKICRTITQERSLFFTQNRLVWGCHKVRGIRQARSVRGMLAQLGADFQIHAFAGLGSPQRFLDTFEKVGLTIVDFTEFPDHHDYTKKDVFDLLNYASAKGIDGIKSGFVTTEKDWVKMAPIIMRFYPEKSELFFVLEVEFEFIDQESKKQLDRVLDVIKNPAYID